MDIIFEKRTEWGKYEREPLIKTIEKYNDMVSMIRGNKNWLKPFVELCKEYYNSEEFTSGGSLHIILEDGNINDGHTSWCAGYACGLNDMAGYQIAELMTWMTKSQRKRVISNYEKYSV